MDDVVCKHGWSRRFCEPCSFAHIISQLKGPRDMGMLAIKPENVPEPVWRAAMSAYHKTLRKNPAMAWQTAVVAALGAWPDAERLVNLSPYDGEAWPHLILPLPTEDNNE